MDMVFKFTEGSGLKGDPNVVGKELHAIRARRGELTPAAIVEEAKAPESPLHQYFEWDNDKAAEKWRVQQARVLVCSVVTVAVDGDETTPVRSFVSVNRSYQPLEVVLSDADMREQVVQDVRDAISSLKKKLLAFEEFGEVLQALERVEQIAVASVAKKPVKRRERAAAR